MARCTRASVSGVRNGFMPAAAASSDVRVLHSLTGSTARARPAPQERKKSSSSVWIRPAGLHRDMATSTACEARREAAPGAVEKSDQTGTTFGLGSAAPTAHHPFMWRYRQYCPVARAAEIFA